jgi:serine protease Do
MFDLDGEVIGINTAIFSPSGGSVGIGFAIPSNSARPVVEQLIAHGQVRRGWLGVRIQAVTDEIAETLGLNEAKGALVASIIEGGPAEMAGIRAGDVVLQFDGKDIDEMRRLPRIVAETDVDKTVDVVVWRGGSKHTLEVKVGALNEGEEKMAARASEKESSKGASEKIDDLGLTIAVLDDKLRQRFEIDDETQGVVVTDVDPSGNAAAKGMRAGDVIVEVSQTPVSTPAEVVDKIEEATKAERKSLLLLVEGESGVRWVAVRIGKG